MEVGVSFEISVNKYHITRRRVKTYYARHTAIEEKNPSVFLICNNFVYLYFADGDLLIFI